MWLKWKNKKKISFSINQWAISPGDCVHAGLHGD